MLEVLKFIVITIVLAVVIFGGFSLLSRYVFNRVRVNKWIILSCSIVSFIIPIIFRQVGFIGQIIFSAIFLILFLWFLDVNKNGYPKIKKDKKIVMKPKAKPNRMKHNEKYEK